MTPSGKITRPPALRPGDLIAIAAPSSAAARRDLIRGAEFIASKGFPVTYREDICAKKGYLAGDDSRRRDELNAFIRDPEVKAILLARGGYGVSRIIDGISTSALKRRPKIVAGYSDATALLLFLQQRCGLPVLHGPFVTDSPRDLSRLIVTMKGGREPLTIGGLRTLRPGKAAAPLTGGNLTLLAHSIGTPFEVETRRRVLFLEEVNEAPYRVDRLIRQLVLAGKFRGISGLLIGRISGAGRSSRTAWERLLLEAVGERKIPVAAAFPAGHGPGNATFPLGVRVRFDTASRSVAFDPFLGM
jgi:muramoyltetrapeptide carboxypeptidase